MRKVLFEYRRADDEKKCRFICKNKTENLEWEVTIKLPYEFGNSFWSLEKTDNKVINKSIKIAKDNNAPEWVFK